MTEEEPGISSETLVMKDDTSVQPQLKEDTFVQLPQFHVAPELEADNLMETSESMVTAKPSESEMFVQPHDEAADNLTPGTVVENSVNSKAVNGEMVETGQGVGVKEESVNEHDLYDEKENVGDCNESSNFEVKSENPAKQDEIKNETSDEVKQEIKDEIVDESYETEFQPKVIKLVNIRGEPFMCQICGYQSRHLRWLRHHETVCQKQGPATAAIPKATLIFARPAGITQQLMINSDLVKMVYPGQTVRLISPHLTSGSTADLIANNANNTTARLQQIVPSMTRFASPSITTTFNNQTVGPSSSSYQNPFQCQLCTFVAATTDALALHVKVNHAPVYSCNYCSYKTKQQEDIKTHLDFQCTLRPPKCYTCVLCNHVIYQATDIEKHFREKHTQYQISGGNYPVRIGYAPAQETAAQAPPNAEVVKRIPNPINVSLPSNQLQPMMMTPSRQKDIIEGYHLCRYCPFKSKRLKEVNDHMKFGHLNTFEFDRNFGGPEVKKMQKPGPPGLPGKIDLRTSCVESGDFQSLEFLPPDSSPTFTATTVIGRPKCAGKRRQDMSYVIQDKIDSIKCSPKEKNFHCEYCDFKTTTTFNLKRHIKNRHKELLPEHAPKEDNSVYCQYCNEKMVLGSLKRHIKAKHPEMLEATPAPKVSCPYCEFTTTNSHNLRRHASKMHSDKLKGPSATPNNSILKSFYCQYCAFTTNSDVNLRRHFNKIHRKPLQHNASPTDPLAKASPAKVSPVKISPVKETPSPAEIVPQGVVNADPVPQSPKDVKSPKEKTICCQECDFKTAYPQNLRRHYEKCHKEIYPALYPERYAKAEAEKAKVLAESIQTEISENLPSTSSENFPVPVPLPNSVPEINVPVVKPIEVLPLSVSPTSIKSQAETTTNTMVNSVKVTDNPNCVTLLYKPQHPIVPESNLVDLSPSAPIHMQINNHKSITTAQNCNVSQEVPPASFPGSHQGVPLNDHESREPRVLPFHSQCNIQFSDQNVVTPLRDKL